MAARRANLFEFFLIFMDTLNIFVLSNDLYIDSTESVVKFSKCQSKKIAIEIASDLVAMEKSTNESPFMKIDRYGNLSPFNLSCLRIAWAVTENGNERKRGTQTDDILATPGPECSRKILLTTNVKAHKKDFFKISNFMDDNKNYFFANC